MTIVTAGGISYHLDNKLLKHWGKNSLYNLKRKNSDNLSIIDGRERIGKTWFAIQQMGAIEPELFNDVKKFLSRICFSPEEFSEAVRNTTNGVIIFDEAFRGFSNRAALSKVNKMLNQVLMEMGQNNNIVFIVLPSFFLLDIYPAMLRSDVLFHITMDKKTNLRAFHGYNRKDKNKTYKIGIKRGWTYPFRTKFRGRFTNKFPGGDLFMNAYLEKKRNALRTMGDGPIKPDLLSDNHLSQRNMLICMLHLDYKMSQGAISRRLIELGYGLNRVSIGKVVDKYKEKWESPVTRSG